MQKIIDKKTHLIETSINLFVNQGIQKTSMSQISEVSEIAVGTIYHHFKSKEELIESVYIFILEDLGKHISFSQVERQLKFKNRFELLWMKGYDYYIKFPNRFMFHNTYSYSPLISNDLREYARSNYQIAFDLVTEGIEKQILINSHPVIIMRWLFNSLATIIQIKLNHELEITDRILENTLKMVWNSLTIK